MKHNNFIVHVVDSDQAIADALATLLDTYGIEVRSYTDAGSFLEFWSPRRWRNCCLIVDADLPGLGAPALLRELRELKVDIPVLVLVGTSTPEMIETARRSGAIGVIQKPCLGHTLIDLVLEFRGAAAAVSSDARG